MDPNTVDAYADTVRKDLHIPIHGRRIHIRRLGIYVFVDLKVHVEIVHYKSRKGFKISFFSLSS